METPTVLLTAHALLNYAGTPHGIGMQFLATKADADKLIESGQASPAKPKVTATLSPVIAKPA